MIRWSAARPFVAVVAALLSTGCVLAHYADAGTDGAQCVATGAETCNGFDDDCDGAIDEGLTATFYADGDGDGFGSTPFEACAPPTGHVSVGGDCDDTAPTIHPDASETCDGVDQDCDMRIDEACGMLAAPALLTPWNGARTGSLHAPDAARRPLRPTLRWQPVPGALRYEVELDRTPGWQTRSCAFGAGVVRGMVTAPATAFTPPADLEVSTTAPVGARYCLRVRACHTTCSAWSSERYVDVGRVHGDLNGDGYSDLASGAPGATTTNGRSGAVLVYYGSSSGVQMAPDLTLLGPNGDDGANFGVSIDTGDLDGDGFDDLAVGIPSADGATTDAGAVWVFFGGNTGLDRSPLMLTPPLSTDAGLGTSVAVAGDVDGDGFDDLIAGAPEANGAIVRAGAVLLFAGGAETIGLTATIEGPVAGIWFGNDVGAGGDVDSDGLADFAVGAPLGGRAWLYRGRAPIDAASAAIELIDPERTGTDRFGSSVAGVDLDGDGFADVVVGDQAHPTFEDGDGAAHLFAGRAGPLPATLAARDFLPAPTQAAHLFGERVAATSDLDGDGVAELLIASPRLGWPPREEGSVFVYAMSTGPSAELRGPEPGTLAMFGFGLAARPDFDGDGLGDVAVGAIWDTSTALSPAVAAEGVVHVLHGSPSGALLPRIQLDSPLGAAGEHGYDLAP